MQRYAMLYCCIAKYDVLCNARLGCNDRLKRVQQSFKEYDVPCDASRKRTAGCSARMCERLFAADVSGLRCVHSHVQSGTPIGPGVSSLPATTPRYVQAI
eukprot:4352993-Pyramimonas_sp.AAC.2